MVHCCRHLITCCLLFSSKIIAMDYSFNAKTFASLFQSAVEDYLLLPQADGENSLQQLVVAMQQAIDVMERADADKQARGDSGHQIEEKDITQIGAYSLTLIEGVVAHVQSLTNEQSRELTRLVVPIGMWIAKHGGKIEQLDLMVNSLASYANELREPTQLADLCVVIRTIIDSVSDEIRQDLEQTNLMRPWRVLNLNYGIVATRSYDPVLIDLAYESLIKHLPQDAREFFKEGMQQMDIVGYPNEVREVVEKYDRMWGTDSTLH